MNDNLWARGGHERHRELYDAEYAKQLERIARIRSEVRAGLPDVALPVEPLDAPRSGATPPPLDAPRSDAPPPLDASRSGATPPPLDAPRSGTAPPPLHASPRWDAAPVNLAPAPRGRRRADRSALPSAGPAFAAEPRHDDAGPAAPRGDEARSAGPAFAAEPRHDDAGPAAPRGDEARSAGSAFAAEPRHDDAGPATLRGDEARSTGSAFAAEPRHDDAGPATPRGDEARSARPALAAEPRHDDAAPAAPQGDEARSAGPAFAARLRGGEARTVTPGEPGAARGDVRTVSPPPGDGAPATRTWRGWHAPPTGPEPQPGDPVGGATGNRTRTAGNSWHPPTLSGRVRWATTVGLVVAATAILLAQRDPDMPAATVFRVPGQPTGVVVDGGRVWVAGPAAGAVWVLDGRSGRVAQPALHVGGTPARLALDRRFAWIADTERGAVVRAPRDGRGSPRPVRGGPDVADVAVAAGAVWTASSADGTIRVIEPAGRRQVLRVGARPVALAADARWVVAADAAGALIRLDARTRRAEGPAVSVGGAPSDVALSGDRAWIADMRAGTVRVVALHSGIAGDKIAVGGSPVAIAADARGVYVLCRGERTLVELDPGTGAVRTRRRLTHSPTALALDPRHVWIAAGEHEVIRVDR